MPKSERKPRPASGHKTGRVDALRSIRRFCLECQGESAAAVRQCTDSHCALWAWRLPEAPAAVLAEVLAAVPGHAPAPLPEAAASASGVKTPGGEAAGPRAAAFPLLMAAQQPSGAEEQTVAGEKPQGDEDGPQRDPRVRKALARRALRAIRRHCLNCAGHRCDVRACAAREDCLLWSLRFGVRPETYKAVRQRFFAPKKLTLF